ncbi:MAG TPA: ABC transporter permease subunit [Actinophytocola sp.]|uniref:ABC transporter permease subunit n=1 Tax=Actinophytocola sp. TaxID=1872138 RepID=UPI002DB879A5|nr:ABC transporter permease subunit [Actinophytocola sp.]HEU5469764.1 ABC transporter permease subunit [Actinophytocola sp.]
MTRLVQAEFGKLFSTKLWLWLLLGALGFTALFVSLTIGFEGQEGNPVPPLSTPEGQRNLFSSASAAGIFALILGIIAVTGEFRHQTATPTFLATPRRGRVISAKLLGYAVTGVGYGILTIAAAIAIALPWTSAKDIELTLTENGIPAVLFGVAASVAVYALLGVGVGALIRNQIAAVVGALVYLFLVEQIVSAVPVVRDYYKWLPGGANNALTGTFVPSVDLLEPWQGGLLLVGYALVFAVLGTVLAVRRDVT